MAGNDKNNQKEYDLLVALREISNIEARIEAAHEILIQASNNLQTNRYGSSSYPAGYSYSDLLNGSIKEVARSRDEFLKLIENLKRHFVQSYELDDVIVDEIPDRSSSDMITGIANRLMDSVLPKKDE